MGPDTLAPVRSAVSAGSLTLFVGYFSVLQARSGQTLGKADADLIRAETGFAIGGVAPLGHLSRIEAYLDPRLLEFDTVWAAAGTPRHVFAIAPGDLLRVTGATQADFTA